MRLPMMSFGPAPRARLCAALGCSCVEIAPCSEFGTPPVPLGCPPGRPNVLMYFGAAFGLLQSSTSIACDSRHSGVPGTSTVLLLPGANTRPVLHSHHCLCVDRNP